MSEKSSAVRSSLLKLERGTARGVTLNDYFAIPGNVSNCSTARERSRRSLPEMAQRPHGLRDLFRSGLGFGRFERGLRASGPCKRLPHLLRPLVRPPALSRGGAWRVGTFGLGRLNTGPFPRPASKLVMQPSVQLVPSFAASALLMLPIFAVPVARCTGAGDCPHLNEQADRQRRNL
jgi:hypothetical protein